MDTFASISRPADFRRVLAEGRRAGDRGLVVYVGPAADREPRLGLVVRASGAVLRNRIKRRLRAAFRAAGPSGGIDVVIRADERAAGKDFQEMVAMIEDALGPGGSA
jgi:ribonuclease P protein component